MVNDGISSSTGDAPEAEPRSDTKKTRYNWKALVGVVGCLLVGWLLGEVVGRYGAAGVLAGLGIWVTIWSIYEVVNTAPLEKPAQATPGWLSKVGPYIAIFLVGLSIHPLRVDVIHAQDMNVDSEQSSQQSAVSTEND